MQFFISLGKTIFWMPCKILDKVWGWIIYKGDIFGLILFCFWVLFYLLVMLV